MPDHIQPDPAARWAGYLLTSDGKVMRCGWCAEAVYHHDDNGHLILRNQNIARLRDGRIRVVSRDFGCVVHECAEVAYAVLEAEAILNASR